MRIRNSTNMDFHFMCIVLMTYSLTYVQQLLKTFFHHVGLRFSQCWNVTPCQLVNYHQYFERPQCLQTMKVLQSSKRWQLFTNRWGITSPCDVKSHFHSIVDKDSGPLPPSSGQSKTLTTMTMEGISSYTTLVNNYLLTWCHIPQDFSLLLSLYLQSVTSPCELRNYNCCF